MFKTKEINELRNCTLNNNELEFISDSCSVYFDHADEQKFKIRIIGHINEYTFLRMIDLSQKIYEQSSFSKRKDSVYYLIDLKYVQSISIRAIHKMRNHNIRDSSILILYNLNFLVSNQLSLMLPRSSKSKIIIKNDEQEVVKYLNEEQTIIPFDKESESIRSITTKVLKSWMIFDKLWGKDMDMITIGTEKFRIINEKKWSYTSANNQFSVYFSVIECNILLITVKGFIKPLDIDHTYNIVNQIIETFRINNKKNKLYSIIDLRQVRGITLKARKKTAIYESEFQQYSHILVVIPSPAATLFVKMLKKLYPEQFKLWIIMNTLSHAFSFLKRFHSHNLSIDKNHLRLADD
ncbi:MAG: hypothetical protein K9H84_01930 [Bacteroidales bacterium]|nr:hypothetical protein [Bacteroidales bacterium]